VTRRTLIQASALCLAALCHTAGAQQPAQKTTKGKAAPTTHAEAVDHLAAGRRALAVSLLNSVADEARDYRDEALRARVQARVADALWPHDAERARTLFRRAWDAAESVEKNAPPPTGTSAPGRVSSSARNSSRPRTNLRSEVLRLAARRDHALGEEFLARLTAAGEESKPAAPSTGPVASGLSPAVVAERLRLAGEFLEAGNVERALQFADPALATAAVSERVVLFLVNLRDKSVPGADMRFDKLLARAAADPSSDANTVSLLTSYAFTPSVYLAVSPEGIPSSMSYAPRPAPDLAPQLRAAFFRAAAQILLRPLAELDQSSAGRGGTYYIIARLLPLFEQHAPAHAPRLRAQLAALRPDAPKELQAGDMRGLDRGIAPEDPSSDKVQRELDDRLDRARTPEERDRAYAFAAMRAADAADPRAREFADKIEDAETRDGLRRFVVYSLVGTLLRKKEVEEALRLARKSDMTHAQRTWVLRRAADILAETDRARAVELLEESVAEARRLDPGTPERAYALAAASSLFPALDRVRAWEVVGETIKAANAVEGFTGENGTVRIRLEGKFSIQMGLELAAPTDIPDAFAALADADLQRAADAARGFAGEAPRALATIAVARAVLEPDRAKRAR
jgi:hypothetical protein